MLKIKKITIVFILAYCVIAGLILDNAHILKSSNQPIKFIVNSDDVDKFSNSRKYLAESVVFESNFIPQPSYLLSAHSSTVVLLSDGRLLALWFAGSHEGNPDVNIWQSYYEGGKWTLATVVATRKSVEHDTKMFIKKVGNPVIYRAKNGNLYLFIVSVSIGGWSGSSINQLVSKNNGKTWSRAKKIILSPFFNVSTLARTSGVGLSNGGFYLPVYHESIRNYPELLYFDCDGNFTYQRRISDVNHLIQPSILTINSTTALAYFRNHSVNNSPLMYAMTNDGAKVWSGLKATNLHNQDSSLATANLGNGNYLMVRNVGSRGKLVLSLSRDGVTWRDIYFLENYNSQNEFSYPSITVNNGMIDILYTWQRKIIKHVRLNYAWLDKVGG